MPPKFNKIHKLLKYKFLLNEQDIFYTLIINEQFSLYNNLTNKIFISNLCVC